MAATVLSAIFALTLAASPVPRSLLVVDSERDAGLSCPAQGQLEQSLRRVLRDAVVSRAPIGSDTLRAELRFDGAAWRLSLTRPGGELALSRRLEGAEGDCEAAANASAVIVERYFTELAWAGQEVRLAALTPSPPLLRQLSVATGVTLGTPIANNVLPGAELVTSARLGAFGFAQLGAWTSIWPASTRVKVDERDRGSLDSGSVSAWVAGGACVGRMDALSLCGGGFAGAWFLSGSANGDLFQKRSAFLGSTQYGGLAYLVQPLGRVFEFGLSVRAGFIPGRPGMAVEGATASLNASSVDLEGGLRIGWRNSF